MDPVSTVASFQYLLPTAAQRASARTTPEGLSTTEYLWDPDLSSPHPVVPIKVTADRRGTTSSLVFPSMDPLVMPAWNEAREVKIPQPEAIYS